MIINPQIIATPDCPTVILRDPMESVDLNAVLQRVLHGQGWGLGTYFNVQFHSHDRTQLLASARFVVTEECEELQTFDPTPDQTITRTVQRRKCIQQGEWDYFNGAEPPKAKTIEAKWNVGKNGWDITVDGEVLYTESDKERAKAIERGDVPLPDKAA